jgi:hypothetical protein
MTRLQLIAAAQRAGLTVLARERYTIIRRGKSVGALGVTVWKDGSIHRSDVDLALVRKMTVTEAARLLKLKIT